MQYQSEELNLRYLDYKYCAGGQYVSMKKDMLSGLLRKENTFAVPRELRLKRKELGLTNQEYILLLDYLDCLSQGETDSLNGKLAELNQVSVQTIESRLRAIEKKGLLRQEVATDHRGVIKGMIYNPGPLLEKLKSAARNVKAKNICESAMEYESAPEIKEKKWKDNFCSTRWYNDVFSEMYEEAAGQPVLTGGREFKSAETYFRRLSQLNPGLDAEALFIRATEGARFMLDSQLRGGVFGWLHKPPDICLLANQAQAVDYQLRCIEKVYGRAAEGREIDNRSKSNVEIVFKETVEEKKHEQIERLFGELREIERRDVRRDFQESLRQGLSGDKSEETGQGQKANKRGSDISSESGKH